MFTGKSSYMSIKSRDIPRRQTCIPLFTKDLQKPFPKVPFYPAKGHLSHPKEHLLPCGRASFAVSKSICYFQFMILYYNTSNVLVLFIISKYFPRRIIRTTSLKQLLFNFPVTPVTPQHIKTH